MSHASDKKAKKKAIQKKNRKTFEMLEALRQMHEADARSHEHERERPKDEPKTSEEVWSAKVATIRNRLTDQRRTSKERWNRFAGTGDEGGRGL